MEAAGPSREPACLQAVRKGLETGQWPPQADFLQQILQEDLAEEAAELLRLPGRQAGGSSPAEALASQLAPFAQKARDRRLAFWQMDTRRCRVRLECAKEPPAITFDDGAIHAILLQAFRLEGLPLALDLGKRPRPLLSLSLPLPSGAAGQAEPVDAVFRREPEGTPADLMGRLNQRLPEGLRVHRWQIHPEHASPLMELALASHWCWAAPPPIRSRIKAGIQAFRDRQPWPWRRKEGDSEAALDLHTVLTALDLTDDGLRFTTAMGPHLAINPLKVLAAVLGGEAMDYQGLVRLSVDQKADPRVGQADRYQPKLKNMYEDAVLLGGGSNVVLIDEDDDEPIHLG